MSAYLEFKRSKAEIVKPSGFIVDPNDLHSALFPFQRSVVARALAQGRCVNGADTGLGKSLMSMAWAEMVVKQTQLPVLILAPLAVAHQFVREGAKFSIPVTFSESIKDVDGPGIYTTNYEKLHRFEGIAWGGVVADEGSILKNFTGKFANQILARFKGMAFKLSASATFAPNALEEMGMQAEFVEVSSLEDMIAQFFIRDRGLKGDFRLKNYAESGHFWEWLSSWCMLIRQPSDVGEFDDTPYQLPKLHEKEIVIEGHVEEPEGILPGMWIPTGKSSDKRHINKSTIQERCEAAAELVNRSPEQWVVWCNSNAESELLAKLIPEAVEVAGRHDDAYKVSSIERFQDGEIRAIVTKDKMFGFGINLQNCWNCIDFPNDSFEKRYQKIRRHYRFGQKHDVYAYSIYHELEGYTTLPNLAKKTAQADHMFEMMLPYQKAAMQSYTKSQQHRTSYQPMQDMIIPAWLYEGMERTA